MSSQLRDAGDLNTRAVIGGNGGPPLDKPAERTPDLRPIILRPCATEDYLRDKGDILDLVRKRIEERGIEPKDIRQTIKGYRAPEHYRVTSGFFDCNISQRRAYQLAAAVGLKRTSSLPWSL